tara:strand:- start:1483 stop:2418 length:936 start_codon:yes stop_codon:yes gene_type:complete
MPIANGQNVKLSIKEEATYGTAITDAAYDVFPFKSVNLTLTKTNHESAVITGDREVQDVIMGALSVAGDVSFDLSNQAAYVTGLLGIMGDNAASSGVIEIGSVRQSYTFHQTFVDLNSNNDVHVFKGCEFNSFSMSIPSDGLIECSFGLIGSTMSTENSEIDGSEANYTDTNNPYHSSDAVISLGGATTAIVTDFSLAIDNGLATTNKIGALEAQQGGISKCRVTGSFTAHFDDSDGVGHYEKFLANTKEAIIVTLGSGSTGMKFTMAEVVYTTSTVEVGGEGLLSISAEFTAIYKDSNNTSSLVIDTDLS